jgi:4'-phosphopantetheinyl transferase
MPQISSKSFALSSTSLQWMIWEITEDLPFFQTFPENWVANKHLENTALQKIVESSAARFCLWNVCQQISQGPWDLKKDDRNRPYFDQSDYHISLSHSFPYVAAVISYKKPVGIDLERFGRQVEKIGPRFLSAEEWNRWQNSHADLTKAWACKEAVYKAMGVPGLAFQQDIQLPSFADNHFKIHVRDKKITISTEVFEDFACSIAIED